MELADLPQQLSPAILTVLLEGLIEYNGVTFRDVPLRTFRGKIVGLYFASIDGEGCAAFVDRLRAFYGEMNHQFEVVLVSCDGSEESYTNHAQSTAWPAYPRGDYRITLLKSHFNVTKCPRLIILDPNGVCVTAEGVHMLERDPHGRQFPWPERPIEMLYSTGVEGEIGQVLARLQLPDHNGVPLKDARIVCLLFCELWCPTSRDLIRRVKFLSEKFQRSAGPDGKCEFNMYHIHNDDLDKYSDFDFMEDLPFVSVRVQDDELRKAVFHFFGVHDQYPSFCVACPTEDWVIRNGVEEIHSDPTGVCFPWRPFPKQNEPVSYVDILKPVQEEDLVHHLCRGPVFIALMHQVHELKDEAMSTVRAAALSYLNLATSLEHSQYSAASQESMNVGEEKDVDAVPARVRGTIIGEDEMLQPVTHLTAIPEQTFEKLKSLLSCPPSHLSDPLAEAKSTDSHHDSETSAPPRLSSQGSRSAGHHGNAPWNNPMAPSIAGRLQYPFLYTVNNSRVAQTLSKFCNFEENTVRQHQAWVKHQMTVQKEKKRAAMDRHLRLEGLEMMSRRASVGTQGQRASQLGQERPPKNEETQEDDQREAMLHRHRSPYLPNIEFPDDDSDESDDEEETERRNMNLNLNAGLQVTDEMLMGDGQVSTGSGIIVDLARGTYYICGSLVDRSCVLQFFDNWERGKLQPLEIRVPNADELLEDAGKDNEPDRRLNKAKTRRFAMPTNLPDNTPRAMPGIVIWLPSKQHSKAGMQVDVIYRALLKHAFHKCPTDDDAVQAASLGRSRCDPDDASGGARGGRMERLTQKIIKFWIFGLEEGPDSNNASEIDPWDSPGSEFLAELRGLVQRNIQQEHARLGMGSVRQAENSSSMPDFLDSEDNSSSGHVKFGKDDEDDQAETGGLGTEVFDPGFDKLRKMHAEGSERAHVVGNQSLCMYTSKSKQDLYSAMMDELAYYTQVRSPPPPLFIMLCGDFPLANQVPWPTVLQGSNVHVVGSVQGLSQYREQVSPTASVLDWAGWLENYADDHISMKISRHLQVPWS